MGNFHSKGHYPNFEQKPKEERKKKEVEDDGRATVKCKCYAVELSMARNELTSNSF